MKISNSIISVLIVSFFSFVFLSSCSNNRTDDSFEKLNQKQKLNHFLMSGSKTKLRDAVGEMIEKSDIRGGGYVVIIPTPDLKKHDKSKVLKKVFYSQQIMAVHILKLNPVSDIKNSEILALENATIICFLGDKSYTLKKLIKKQDFKDALISANENGALITGIGNASSALGEKYLWSKNNKAKNSRNITLENGIGLLKNVIIDDTSFINKGKDVINKKLPGNNYTLIGTNDDASFYINESQGVVLNESAIEVSSKNSEKKLFNKGQKFNIKVP